MAIRDRNISKDASVARECLSMALGTTATGQTAALTNAITPGFSFRVVKVSVFAETVTATISVDVQIGGTSVLASAITPVAGTETAGTISATNANQIGGSSAQLQFKYTSNGTGAATGCVANVWIVPLGLEHDPKTIG